MRCFLSCVELY